MMGYELARQGDGTWSRKPGTAVDATSYRQALPFNGSPGVLRSSSAPVGRHSATEVVETRWWGVTILGAALLTTPLNTALSQSTMWGGAGARIEGRSGAELSSTAVPEVGLLPVLEQSRADRLTGEIERFRELTQPGWDGESAAPIPAQAVWDAVNFINELEDRPHLLMPDGAGPSPYGDVVLYWASSNYYVEINFSGSDATICHRVEANEMVAIEGIQVSDLIEHADPIVASIINYVSIAKLQAG